MRKRSQEDWRSYFLPGYDKPEAYHGEDADTGVLPPYPQSPEFLRSPYPEPTQADPYFQSEQPIFGNTETNIVGRYLMEDKLAKKYNKYVSKRFQETFDPDTIHEELSEILMNDVLGATTKLNDPFNKLIIDSLQRVDWDQIASQYTYPYGSKASPDQFSMEKSVDRAMESLLQEIGTPEQAPAAQPAAQPVQQTPQRRTPETTYNYTAPPAW